MNTQICKQKVVVGLSGGVDSSLTALLLLKRGYDVIGLTIKMSDASNEDAKKVAQQLSILYCVIDITSFFKDTIIDPFLEGYAQGETPLPCAMCNRHVKMDILSIISAMFDSQYISTGHYVVKKDDQIFMGLDNKRDQSFFLFYARKEQLRRLILPLGGFTKNKTRALAQEYGILTAQKPASNDLCFMKDPQFIERYKTFTDNLSWDVVDEEGKFITKHHGIATVGQRKGLSTGGMNDKKYIRNIDKNSRTITVSDKTGLEVKHIYLKDFNWLGENNCPDILRNLYVKMRSAGSLIPAIFHFNEQRVELLISEYGIAPGQACVFYINKKLVGGGWIKYCK